MSKVISLCDHFDGIFLSKFAFDLYTLVGLKDNKFKILSFENFRFLDFLRLALEIFTSK